MWQWIRLERQCVLEPDDSGRRRPVAVKGSEFHMECDLCIVAVGSGANPLLTSETPDMKLNDWGYVMTDEKTGKPPSRVSGQVAISSPVQRPLFLPWVPAGRPLTQSMII
jgi:NADPH-dependent glutamate synthase beta subunit-like oxidoreductase